jgi:acetoin utilization protein AcuB
VIFADKTVAENICVFKYLWKNKGSDMVNEIGQVRVVDLIDDMFSGKDVFFHSVRFVKDAMTENVRTLALDDTIETCLEIMKGNRVRHVPVVDSPTGQEKNPYLIGVVSDRDILRQVSPYLGKIGETYSDPKVIKQPLMQIITRNPITVSPETPITDAISLIIDNHINMLPVLSDKNLVGIITSADILMLFIRSIRLDKLSQLHTDEGKKEQRKNIINMLCKNSDELTFHVSEVLQTVEDVMSEQVVCLDEEESIAKALEIMQAGNFRHLPVVGKAKKLVGLLSDRDILRHLQYNRKQFQSQTDNFCTNLLDVAPNDPVLKQTVHHIMSHKIAHVQPNHDFYAAVKMLYEMKISCLPVVDDKKSVLGVFTVTDVMRGLLAVYVLYEKFMLASSNISNDSKI